MNNDKLSADALVPFNPWHFGILWVLLHLISELLLHFLLPMIESATAISIPVSPLPEERWDYLTYFETFRTLIFGLIIGLVIGTVEWYVLHHYFEWSKWWIGMTIVGSILNIFWYSFTSRFMTADTAIIVFFITATISGILLAVAQWIVLQKETYYAYLWILTGFVAGVAGAVVIEVYIIGINGAVNPYSLEGVGLQMFRKATEESIKVAALIGLLSITLKRDETVPT